MQQWQFKQELERLKRDLVQSSKDKSWDYIDSKTDEFLLQHGIESDNEELEKEADVQNDLLM